MQVWISEFRQSFHHSLGFLLVCLVFFFFVFAGNFYFQLRRLLFCVLVFSLSVLVIFRFFKGISPLSFTLPFNLFYELSEYTIASSLVFFPTFVVKRRSSIMGNKLLRNDCIIDLMSEPLAKPFVFPHSFYKL